MSYKKVKLKSLNKSDDLVIDDDVKREEELNFDCNSIVTVKHKKKRKYQISENGQDLNLQSETSHGKHKKKKKLLNDENDDFNSSHHQFDDSDLNSKSEALIEKLQEKVEKDIRKKKKKKKFVSDDNNDDDHYQDDFSSKSEILIAKEHKLKKKNGDKHKKKKKILSEDVEKDNDAKLHKEIKEEYKMFDECQKIFFDDSDDDDDDKNNNDDNQINQKDSAQMVEKRRHKIKENYDKRKKKRKNLNNTDEEDEHNDTKLHKEIKEENHKTYDESQKVFIDDDDDDSDEKLHEEIEEENHKIYDECQKILVDDDEDDSDENNRVIKKDSNSESETVEKQKKKRKKDNYDARKKKRRKSNSTDNEDHENDDKLGKEIKNENYSIYDESQKIFKENSSDSDKNIEELRREEEKRKEMERALNKRSVPQLLAEYAKKNKMSDADVKILWNLEIKLIHEVPQQHLLEPHAGCHAPSAETVRRFQKYIELKKGPYSVEEDIIIIKNWKKFCKLHNWNKKNHKPFFYWRQNSHVIMRKPEERRKFVQFLANGLPNRTLYSVLHRFRNMHSEHTQERYTKRDDEIILDYIKDNSDNSTVFANLAKVLNRTRASVWRRYRLLKKKKNKN